GQTEDGKLYTAGIGVGVENTPAGMQSQVLILADRFAVLNQDNGVTSTPFAIDGGQVFMNIAFIKDGTITNAKIGDYIQSSNYVAGSTGWRIGKDGAAEFQNGTFRGTINATAGTLENVTITDTATINRVVATSIEGDIATGSPLSVDVGTPSGGATISGTFYKTINATQHVDRIVSIICPVMCTVSSSDTTSQSGYCMVDISVNGNTIASAEASASSASGEGSDNVSGVACGTYIVPAGSSVTFEFSVSKHRGNSSGAATMQAGPALLIATAVKSSDWS
ncbi:phage tail tip fiber protein, partial [Martelella alba]